MEESKFVELCSAFGRAQDNFQNYQKNCHQFAVAFVEKLKSYYKVPETQFSLYKINDQNQFNLVQPAVVNAISLRPDSIWQFGIGLTVCAKPETLPKELILIHILIRKDLEGNFYLKYGKQPQEHKIEKTDKYDFVPFLDFLHDTIVKTYDEHLNLFIGHDTRRQIGF